MRHPAYPAKPNATTTSRRRPNGASSTAAMAPRVSVVTPPAPIAARGEDADGRVEDGLGGVAKAREGRKLSRRVRHPASSLPATRVLLLLNKRFVPSLTPASAGRVSPGRTGSRGGRARTRGP